MRRVRRLIRRTKLVRTKYQNLETQDPFESPFQTEYSNLPYIEASAANELPLKLDVVNKPPVQSSAVNEPLLRLDPINKPPVQVNAVNEPPVKVEQVPRKPLTDYVSLAMKTAQKLYNKTSLEHIDKVAKDLFKFDIDPHLHITMPDVVAQEIFDWIITLKDRPMFEKERLKLARKFIAGLASARSPVEKPDAL